MTEKTGVLLRGPMGFAAYLVSVLIAGDIAARHFGILVTACVQAGVIAAWAVAAALLVDPPLTVRRLAGILGVTAAVVPVFWGIRWVFRG